VTAALRRSTLSLSVPNYRRWFYGQVVSISGNWMQTVAEMWLVVHLTGSGVAVGITAALQFAPILLFGALGGVLADRCDKRRLLMLTQTLMAVSGAMSSNQMAGFVMARHFSPLSLGIIVNCITPAAAETAMAK
jgi:nitrate/nitrite transporter NarK